MSENPFKVGDWVTFNNKARREFGLYEMPENLILQVQVIHSSFQVVLPASTHNGLYSRVWDIAWLTKCDPFDAWVNEVRKEKQNGS